MVQCSLIRFPSRTRLNKILEQDLKITELSTLMSKSLFGDHVVGAYTEVAHVDIGGKGLSPYILSCSCSVQPPPQNPRSSALWNPLLKSPSSGRSAWWVLVSPSQPETQPRGLGLSHNRAILRSTLLHLSRAVTYVSNTVSPPLCPSCSYKG